MGPSLKREAKERRLVKLLKEVSVLTPPNTQTPPQTRPRTLSLALHSLPLSAAVGKQPGPMDAKLDADPFLQVGLATKGGSKVGGLLAGGLSIRGLSGGEKRRLSICCGTVAKPSLLFLDGT